jgi:Family of unknown function (DUF5335)
MSNQATATTQDQDFITTAKLDENKVLAVPNNEKTIEIPKEKWTEFRFGWGTKVEVLDESIGEQVLSEGLILNGITHENKSGNCLVEISLGENPEHHQTHIISKPLSIAYFVETDSHLGVLEIIEENHTKTRISLINPMPVLPATDFTKPLPQ